MIELPTITDAIPGPPEDAELGPVGNYVQFFQDRVGFMMALQRRYGNLVAIVPGGPSAVFAFGPEMNRAVFTRPGSFDSVSLVEPGPHGSAQWRMSQGIFALNGVVHREIRRRMMPPVRQNAFDKYWGPTVSIIHRHMDQWPIGQPVDIHELMLRVIIDISYVNLFGIEPEGDDLGLARRILTWSMMSNHSSVKISDEDRPSAMYRNMMAKAERIESEITQLIRRKRELGTGGDDLFSRLLQAHDEGLEGIGEQEIRGHVMITLAAAFETTSGSSSWLMYLLAQHPETTRRLCDDLRATLGGQAPRIEQFRRLEYLEWVINEGLRLLGPVVYTIRRASETTVLGGYEIPEGSVIFNSPYVTHRLPEIFDQPFRFIPERWQSIKPTPFEYLPFGAGPRICIGQHLALFMMRILFSMMLQRFDFQVVPNSRINRAVSITMYPKQGVPMVITVHRAGFQQQPVRGDVQEMVEHQPCG